MINENEARILSDGFRIYNDDGSSDVYDIIPPSPSLNHRGGIIAGTKTEDDTVEIKIGEDGKGYVPTYPVIIDALSKTNVEEYTPTEDYHPATKKYVDDTVNDSINSLEPCSWSEVTDKPFGEEKVCDTIFENVELTSTYQFVTGSNTARVNLNGPVQVIYNDVGYIFEEDSSDYGDRDLVNYPFYINCYKDGRWIVENENPGDIISLYATKTVINQLDEKFIPDTIARIPDWDVSATDSTNRIDNKPFGKVLEFVKQTKDYYQPSDGTITWSLYSSLTPPFKIIHNGNEYVFDTFPFGDETFTEYPFYVSCTRVTIAGGASMLVYKIQTLNAEDVIEFYSTEEVEKKLDKKYLPATYVETVNGNAPDENGNVELESCKWEDIQDKPFGEEITNYELIFENVEMTSATQSVEGLNTDSSWNVFKFPMKVIYNNTEYIITQPLDGQDVCGDSNLSEYPFSIEPANSIYWGIKTANIGDVISMYIANTEINPIDEKYIPDTIQRTSSVLTQANTNSASGSYSPTEDTDLTTKGYVDDSIEAIPSDVFIVNASYDSYEEEFTVFDKTYEEIKEALDNGFVVLVNCNGQYYHYSETSWGDSYPMYFISIQYSDYAILLETIILSRDNVASYSFNTLVTKETRFSDLHTNSNKIIGAINELNIEIDEKQDKNLIVTVTSSTDDEGITTYSADKTFEDIDEAYNNDKDIICKYGSAIHKYSGQGSAGESAFHVFRNTITTNAGVKEQAIWIFNSGNVSRTKGTFTQDQIATVNTNSSLTTTDKTIVGAINEINSSLTSSVSSHNTSTESHSDIRILISTLTTNLTNLTTRLNALADSDDETLDQMSEVVALIKNNASLIEGITTSKVNVKDIIDNLTTDSSDKPLSAAQGVVLKALIDAIIIPTLLSQLSEDSTHRLVTDDEKELWNNKSDFSGNYNDLTNIPTFSIEKHTDGLIYIFINGVPTGTGLDINTISDTTEE